MDGEPDEGDGQEVSAFTDQWEQANTLAILRLQALQAQLEETEDALDCANKENLRLLAENVRNRGILREVQAKCEHVPSVWYSASASRDMLECERCRKDLDDDVDAHRTWMTRLMSHDQITDREWAQAALDAAAADIHEDLMHGLDLKGLAALIHNTQPNENEEP